MSEARSLLKSSTVYLAGNVITAAVSFGTVPVLTRILSPADYGLSNLFQFYAAVLSNVIMMGSFVPMASRYHTQSREQFASFCASALQIVGTLSLLSLVVLLFLLHSSQSLLVRSFGRWGLLLAVSGFAQAVVVLLQTLFQTKLEPRSYVVTQISLSALGALLTFALLPLTGIPWHARLLALVFTQSGLALFAFVCFRNWGLLSQRPTVAGILNVVESGWKVLPHTLSTTLAAQIDQYNVARFVGFEAAGCYALAAQISSVIESGSSALSRAFTSLMCSSLKKNPILSFRYWIRLGGLAMLSLAVLYLMILLLMKPLLTFLAPPGFSSAQVYIPILCGRSMVQAVQYLLLGFAVAYEATWIFGVSSIISAGVNLGLTRWLAQHYAARGAAYGSLAGSVVTLAAVALMVSSLRGSNRRASRQSVLAPA